MKAWQNSIDLPLYVFEKLCQLNMKCQKTFENILFMIYNFNY